MEVHHYYFIIGALILCTAPVLLLALAHVESGEEKPREIRFDTKDVWRQLREENTHLASLSQLLRRAGLFRTEDQVKALVAALLAIAFLTLVAFGACLYRGLDMVQALSGSVLAFFVITYFAYVILKNIAESRQARLDQETLMLTQTTRMLWRVGLSLPRTLSIICEELRDLSPTCSQELRSAVTKIEAGQSQEVALYELINSCSAVGFKEYLIVIRQQSITGGSIDKALDELYKLLQNRRRLDLQEDVNKMSGKMSIAMMVFLFPAMLIVIAGPGLMSISRALTSMGG